MWWSVGVGQIALVFKVPFIVMSIVVFGDSYSRAVGCGYVFLLCVRQPLIGLPCFVSDRIDWGRSPSGRHNGELLIVVGGRGDDLAFLFSVIAMDSQ